MPLFGKIFSPKKTPLRNKNTNLSTETIDELVSGQRTVHLKLGDQQFLFEGGEWTPESGVNSATHKSNKKLRQKINELQEENNLLQLKYELILNMFTKATAESHNNQQREIENVNKLGKNRSKS